jgi:hypothetical protein
MMSIIDDVARLIASYALFILKPFYPILRLVADFYFAVIELLFKSRNSLPFCRGERILWPARDDPLLCISAKAAAEKIISKQVFL